MSIGPLQSARFADQHSVADDCLAGAVASGRGAARTECASDRRQCRGGRCRDQPDRQQYADRSVLPARRHQLAELQRRQPAERHVQPALGQCGRAESRHRTRPVADRRTHRRQRPDHRGEPVGREFLQGRPGQRRRGNGQRCGHHQPELHGRRHEVRPARQARRPGQQRRHDHREAGGPRGAGRSPGGELGHHHRAVGSCGAGRCEDRDARSVWRRAAVARCEQSGDAGAKGSGRQAGDRAGNQHGHHHR